MFAIVSFCALMGEYVRRLTLYYYHRQRQGDPIVKRIHTFDELREKANRFRALMRQLYGERGATEKLPQNELTLGLLVIAREETKTTGSLPEDVAEMRTTIHSLTNSSPLLYEADTWLVAELVRLRSETDQSLSGKLETAAQEHRDDSPSVPLCMGGLK